jgi:hypothetical protein
MLIQAAPQNATSVANLTSSISPSGVEQGVVRSDIPPVEESERNAAGQNQQFSSSQTYQQPALSGSAEQAAAADLAAPPNNGSSSEPASDSAADSRAAQDESREARSVQQKQAQEDQVIIEQLKARDREVRVHEAAHASVGGRYAGSASLSYTRGPDGKNYATGGEVSISTSAIPGDPQATIEKARVIQAAALAPAQPSSQDRRVAADAAQMEVQARVELQEQKVEEARQQKEAQAEQAEEASEEEAVSADETVGSAQKKEAATPQFTPITTQSAETESRSDTDSESESTETSAEQRPNAREELEKILLGSVGLLQQANQQGLVDPSNPYGKSGYLDIIA